MNLPHFALAMVLAAALAARGARADRRPTPNLKCSRAEQSIAAGLEQGLHKTAAEHVKKYFTPQGSYLVRDDVYGGVPEIVVINARPNHVQQIVKKGPQRPAAAKKAPAKKPQARGRR